MSKEKTNETANAWRRTHTHTHTHTSIFTEELLERELNFKPTKENLVLFAVQKLLYIKIKDGLLEIIICPFCVQKGVINSS